MGLGYDAHRIDIMAGDQFTSGFVDLNPNSKIPAMLDREGPGGLLQLFSRAHDCFCCVLAGNKPIRVFESGSILLYLAEKTGLFLSADPRKRTETLNWLFHQIGAAPFFGQVPAHSVVEHWKLTRFLCALLARSFAQTFVSFACCMVGWWFCWF